MLVGNQETEAGAVVMECNEQPNETKAEEVWCTVALHTAWQGNAYVLKYIALYAWNGRNNANEDMHRFAKK